MENKKIIAHIPMELLYQNSWSIEDPFLILAKNGDGYMWYAVEQDTLNWYDYECYKTADQAVEGLKDEYGADNVVIEPYHHIEVS